MKMPLVLRSISWEKTVFSHVTKSKNPSNSEKISSDLGSFGIDTGEEKRIRREMGGKASTLMECSGALNTLLCCIYHLGEGWMEDATLLHW